MKLLSNTRAKFLDLLSKLWFGWLMSLFVHPVCREEWESQYLSGQWNHLRKLDELAHYSIIVGYFEFFKHGGSILDIGCGEGILQERLSPHAYSKYVGIDISSEAISRASRKQDEKTFFVAEDANDFTPTESFDVIVFNESLYYFDDPLKHLKRYERYLEDDGIFIVSMYLNGQTRSIWKWLELSYPPLDETKVTNRSGTSWICKVFVQPCKQDVDNDV